MKKLKISIIALIIISIIIVICLLIITQNDNYKYNTKFSEETISKLERIKKIINENMYFPFEDGNKKYILLGYRISSYSDPEKSNMEIIGTTYKNGNIVIELKINEVRKRI